MSEHLEGGREGIIKVDNYILRPSELWTKHIHKFLGFLHENHFTMVPFPYAINEDGREKLSYVEGTVYNELLPADVQSDEMLISVARTMKAYHDLGAKYIELLTGEETWMLPIKEPVETMCHGDFAPYNIAVEGKKVLGIIDFDTLHPGPRLWDIAYVLYRWLPLMAVSNPERFGDEVDMSRRMKLFQETYGIEDISIKELLGWVIKRLTYLVDYMVSEAESGNETFKEHIESGHLDLYKKDIRYIKSLIKNDINGRKYE